MARPEWCSLLTELWYSVHTFHMLLWLCMAQTTAKPLCPWRPATAIGSTAAKTTLWCHFSANLQPTAPEQGACCRLELLLLLVCTSPPTHVPSGVHEQDTVDEGFYTYIHAQNAPAAAAAACSSSVQAYILGFPEACMCCYCSHTPISCKVQCLSSAKAPLLHTCGCARAPCVRALTCTPSVGAKQQGKQKSSFTRMPP